MADHYDSGGVGVKRILKAQIDVIDLMASKSRQVNLYSRVEYKIYPLSSDTVASEMSLVIIDRMCRFLAILSHLLRARRKGRVKTAIRLSR